jgi:hypothetical protein
MLFQLKYNVKLLANAKQLIRLAYEYLLAIISKDYNKEIANFRKTFLGNEFDNCLYFIVLTSKANLKRMRGFLDNFQALLAYDATDKTLSLATLK